MITVVMRDYHGVELVFAICLQVQEDVICGIFVARVNEDGPAAGFQDNAITLAHVNDGDAERRW
jgi:hypothetical protein